MSSSARRPCIEPGCPTLTAGTRCPAHEAARQRTRNHARGDRYGTQHRTTRRYWQDLMRYAVIDCARCNTPIRPHERWDLDHLPDGTQAPSHATCNRAARQNPPTGG